MRTDAPAPGDGEERELLRAVMTPEAKYRVAVYLYCCEGFCVKKTAGLMGPGGVFLPVNDL